MRWEEFVGHDATRRRVAIFRGRPINVVPFCYHCGTILPPDNSCPSCGQKWARLFTNTVWVEGDDPRTACPECAAEKEDGAWQHLYPPAYAQGEGDRVLLADGIAECEFAHLLLYRWTPTSFTYQGATRTTSFNPQHIGGPK